MNHGRECFKDAKIQIKMDIIVMVGAASRCVNGGWSLKISLKIWAESHR